MARSYANFTTAIWRDDDFRALTMAEQHCFMMLNTQADISAVGVLTVALTRWASRTAGGTQADIRDAIAGLEAKGFLVVDEVTEEVLIRSFVRWDKGYNNYKRQPSIHEAADVIESPKLRRALAAEFERLDAPKECIPESYSLMEGLSDSPSDSHPDSPPSRAPARVVVTKDVSTPHSTLPFPQSTTRVPAASGGPREGARKRATRIRDDFAANGVTPEMVTWARTEAPDVNGSYETAKFVDYWRGKSGKDATKTDWPATWRNWMRKAQQDIRRPRGPATGANRHTAQRHDNPFSES